VAGRPTARPATTVGTTEASRAWRGDRLDLPALLAATRSVVIGTTFATNVVATHTGARTGITTCGYRDRLAFLHVAKSDLGGDRGNVPAELFSFRSHSRCLVPAPTVEVDERLDFRRSYPRQEDVRSGTCTPRALNRSPSTCCIHRPIRPRAAHRGPDQEMMPHAFVALSSRVLPVRGEVSRWARRHSAPTWRRITEFAADQRATPRPGLRRIASFIQSNGGVATGEVARNPRAVAPPGRGRPPLGSLWAAYAASATVTADMGGTSLDISIIAEGGQCRAEEDHRRQEVRPADRGRQRRGCG
jgi:N-methylhydantoinase A/oxoprolinase/acetone carboxylase beta subunit